jgi:cytochrome c oxidase assembly protein subunit 15
VEGAKKLKRIKPAAFTFLFVVFLQIALGGWTTSNYADVACPELPTCQGQWLPTMDFAQGFNIFQDRGPNYLGGKLDNEARMAIHFSHRMGALVTLLTGLFLVLLLWRTQVLEARRMGLILAAVLSLQILLGLSNIIFKFPVAVAVAHNLGGLLLLLTTVTLLHRLITLEER